MDDVNAQQNVGYAAHEVNPTDYDDTMKSRVDGTQLQSYKTQKSKYPPPSNELIFGHNENDVLLGRGATTNIHSGNQHFRNICAMRKQQPHRTSQLCYRHTAGPFLAFLSLSFSFLAPSASLRALP